MYTWMDGILKTILCDYVYVVVDDIYTYETGHFGNALLCLCLCCSRVYVHMEDWVFWQQVFVFMFLLLKRVCTHVRLVILENECLCLCLCCCRGYLHM